MPENIVGGYTKSGGSLTFYTINRAGLESGYD